MAGNGGTGRQRTLAEPSIAFRGLGLHSGKEIAMRMLPAPAGSGITFVRTDVATTRIEVKTANVHDTLLATTVSVGNVSVGTIEHLLSALCACGVDNIDIELDGPEVPIMDGSARPFVTILQDCGMVELAAPKEYLRVKEEISVTVEGGRKATFSPHPMAVWDVLIEFQQPVVRKTPQRRVFELSSNAVYLADIAGARTFGFVDDLDTMRSQQRALGGSLGNAVVLSRTEVLNNEGLRQPDEFVCHKLLDAIGDCYTEGRLILGSYVSNRPGHALNHELIRALLGTPTAYELVTAEQFSVLPDYGPLRASSL